ncbi:hypothetical protein EDD98_1380 [Streptomyces sp. PanSC19]|uniref:hypothetical protein n=1 Tax=Streptomyces sp. PanSC19 TaxID=1520455 RepID=UPI000F46FE26|nr:hypothetical protein [Streptomyces sp. PanSC19]ROQ32396.1 hypothetical protein EDD98_1380 [Streptomyces sp. PanSC19]
MFEIHIICDPDDTDRVTTALSATFTTGAVRRSPTRDGVRTRLYVTADHRPAPESEWPAPETAYAKAPSIISEIGWTARTAADRPFGGETSREFWLRKAALLDRIALGDEVAPAVSDAAEVAVEAARRLMDVDGAAVICDPRHYVRQQYAHWTTGY